MDEKFTQAVCRIVENDKRYHLSAYEFISGAVSYTIHKTTAQKIRAAPVIFQDRNS